MRNINKRSLLTTSPRMKHGPGLSTLGMAFLCALFLFFSQSGFAQILPGSPEIPAITVTGGSTICRGTTTALSDAATGGTWTSSNTAVATVGLTTGIVTGVTGGVVQITYTKGLASIYTTITVTYPISGTPFILCAGNTLNVTDTTYSGLWSSSNTAVVTVSPLLTSGVSTGELTGMSAGTAIITYGRPGACAVTQTVTVNANNVGAINATGALGACMGGSITATDTTAGGNWASSNISIATINSSTGVINGVSAGAATITYTAGSGCWVTKPLVVSSPSSLAAIAGSASVCVGNTVTLTDATPLGMWSGSNPAIATVYPGGVINGVSAGTVTITYSKSGCSVFQTETVNANTIAPITGATNVCLGGTTQLADATPAGAWASGNTTIATISGTGLVTGMGVGTSVVSYSVITYTVGGCYVTTSVVVNPTTSVGAISGASSLCQGSTTALTDAVPGGAWSSSNTAIGSINASGVVTGITSGTITISYSRLGCTATDAFTVNAIPSAISGTIKACLKSALIKGVDTLSDPSTGGVWSSSNPSLATIGISYGSTHDTCTIIPVGSGVDTIYFTYPLTGCYVKTTDTIYNPSPITGGNSVCIAPMTYLNLHDATSSSTGGTGSWATSNSAIASVSSGGAVTGVAPGTCTISYTVSMSGLSCIITTTVNANPAPGPISGNFSTCVGGTTALTDTATSPAWSSSNTSIATVGAATGIVTGVASGGVIITCSKNGCNATKSVTIGAALPAITGPASVCASYAQIVDTDAIAGGTWSATNATGLIEITQTGSTYARVTGVTAGSTSITYTLAGCSVSKGITVVSDGAGSITGYNTVCSGSTVVLTSSGAGGVWTSSNTAVANYIAGATTPTVTVSGVSMGTTVLTYTLANGCFKTMAPFYVKQQPTAIMGTASICNGAATTYSCTPTGGAWTSSSPHIASVAAGISTGATETGIVTGATAGHATISYALAGGCAAIFPIEVFPMPYTIAGTASSCYTGANGDSTVLSDVMNGGIWSVSNGNAVIEGPNNDSSVIISGVTAGSVATITYSVGSCYQTKAFTVGSVTPTFIGSNPGPLSICAGGVYDSLTYSPGGGTWTSSNSYVAAISSGKVSGIGVGTAVISYNYNGCYVFQTETVTAVPWPAITGNSVLCGGGSQTTLSDAMPGKWSSSNPTIASIGSATGIVTANVAGSVIFTDSAANIVTGIHTQGGCVLYFSMNIGDNTTAVPAIGGYTTPAVCVGSGLNLTDATTGGSWSSSNSGVATINSSGELAGVTAGTVAITYAITGCPTSLTVTVNPLPAPISGPTNVCTTTPVTLTDASTYNGIAGTWSSSKTNWATVSSGNSNTTTVTGDTAGAVTITYKLGSGCTATYAMSVGMPVTFSADSSMCSGSLMTIRVYPSAATNGVWTNFNPLIESVSGMVINGFGSGVDTLYYTEPGCPAVEYWDTVNYVAPIIGAGVICNADTMTLRDATTGGVWSLSNNTDLTILSGFITSTAAGNDTVTYTVTFPNAVAHTCAVSLPMWIDGGCTGREAAATNAAQTLNEKQAYTLYPNPGDGNLTITQSVIINGANQVSVMNYVGEKVYEGPIIFDGGKAQLNLSVASGVYLVMLQDNKGAVQTFKVVVEN